MAGMSVTTVTMEQGGGPERYKHQNEPTRMTTFMEMTNALAHISMGFIAFGAYFIALSVNSGSFSTHIYLCVTGYIILMALGILSLSPQTGWARTLSYQERRVTHISLLVVGSILAIIGSIIRMINTSFNFNSTHGIIGILAMIFTMLNLIGGLINNSSCSPRFIRRAHKLFGICTMLLVYLALIFAFTGPYRTLTSNPPANFMIVFTVIAMVTTLWAACNNFFRCS